MNHFKLALQGLIDRLPRIECSQRKLLRRKTSPMLDTDGHCLYFLFRNGDLVYIGKTIDLEGRIKSHAYSNNKAVWWDHVSVLPCNDAETLEGAFIKAFRPVLNRSKHLRICESDLPEYRTEKEKEIREMYLSL